MIEPYLIWSNEHRAWWRANSLGYTRFVTEAGRYDRDHALRICTDANRYRREGETPKELPILESDALVSVYWEKQPIRALGVTIGEGIPVLQDGAVIPEFGAYKVTLTPEFVDFVNAVTGIEGAPRPIPMITPLDSTFDRVIMTQDGLELWRWHSRIFVPYRDLHDFGDLIEKGEPDIGAKMILKLNEAFGDEHYEPAEDETANDPLPRPGLSDARKRAIAKYLARKDNP